MDPEGPTSKQRVAETTDKSCSRDSPIEIRERIPRILALLSTTTLPHTDSFTAEVLFILKDNALRTCDVARITEKPNAYVDSYLRRTRNYGLVAKEGSFWRLTVIGESFLQYLEKIDGCRYRYRHKVDTTTTQQQHSLDTQKPKKPKQVPLLPFLSNLSLPDAERRVVEVFLDHYDKTGSPFFLVKDQYELAEKIQLDPQLLQDAILNLVQDLRLYKIPVEQGTTKIGLKKAFIELLRENAKCGEAESGQCAGPH